LHLELERSLEHEEELVLVLVAVPVDQLALDHGESDDGVIHARERLIHPRLIPGALCGDVDPRKLTVLVVISDVVALHTHLPVAGGWHGKRILAASGRRRLYLGAQSSQTGSTKTPSPPSGRSEPTAITSRPSSPA